MPSPRRLRLLMLATIVGVVLILFYASSFDDAAGRDTRTIKDFYHKTMDGMTKGGPAGQAVLDSVHAGGGGDDEDRRHAAGTKERLKAAEQRAKAKANVKALRPDPPSQVVGIGNSAEGQAKKPRPDVETQEERDVETELNAMLRKRTVIIFSKSHCPFSARAKGILLEKYTITPEPLVVELDQHRIGRALQDALGELTHRRTVPNIMINGVSIGGSDEVVKLDNTGELADKIRELGNKEVQVTQRLRAGDSRRA